MKGGRPEIFHRNEVEKRMTIELTREGVFCQSRWLEGVYDIDISQYYKLIIS